MGFINLPTKKFEFPIKPIVLTKGVQEKRL